ncbi:MAG: SMP-30/gluconolactonase/LRE family protein [Magnetococcales bacterium]|nr:SMP-30/gluconolactonase/LRE family protein [Magnetococcales bacterium]
MDEIICVRHPRPLLGEGPVWSAEEISFLAFQGYIWSAHWGGGQITRYSQLKPDLDNGLRQRQRLRTLGAAQTRWEGIHAFPYPSAIVLYQLGLKSLYAPTGEIERVIILPVRRPTSCTFGGKNLDQLLVTSPRQSFHGAGQNSPLDGGLFRIDVGIQGLPS